MIPPLITFQHENEWFTPKEDDVIKSGERSVAIDINSEEYEYLRDYIIDGRNVFPTSGFINLVWETKAFMHNKTPFETSVVFEDIRFHRTIYILGREIQFHVSIHPGSGHFEVTENNVIVVTGHVFISNETSENIIDSFCKGNILSEENMLLNTNDIYKILGLKEFHYREQFRNLIGANIECTLGKLRWNNNFVTFMDSLSHLKILTQDSSELLLPAFIQKIVINTKNHFKYRDIFDEKNYEFPSYYDEDLNMLYCGGVEIHGLKFNTIARKKVKNNVVLQKYQFVPNFCDHQIDLNSAIRLCTQIVLENLQVLEVNSVELLQHKQDTDCLISNILYNTLNEVPLIQVNVSILLKNELNDLELEDVPKVNISRGSLLPNKSFSLIITSNISENEEVLPQLFNALTDNAFIIAKESKSIDDSFEKLGLDVCFHRNVGHRKIYLLRKKIIENANPFMIKINNFSYPWVLEIQQALEKIDIENHQKIIIYAEKEPDSGILGFFNCIRREFNDDIFRCFFIMDKTTEFSLLNPMFKSQFNKSLSHNVYNNGQWGTYRYLPLEPLHEKKCMHVYANITVCGNLSTLRWFEGSIDPLSYKGEKPLIYVYNSAINIQDIALATGKVSAVDIGLCKSRLQEEHILGREFSGKDQNGIRYMGISWPNAITSCLIGNPHTLWRVPHHMTLEEAATIPTAYITAILAVVVHGKIRRKQSVLIHEGNKCVGQACIEICIYYECDVFTTVGTATQVNSIRKRFPQIPASQIGNSKYASFEKMIMKLTNGKGVDIVVNSLPDEKFHASLRCVGERGKFIDIGSDILKNVPIVSYDFLRTISFHSITSHNLINASTEDRADLFRKMQEMLDAGVVKPLRRIVFASRDIGSAFRYMASGKRTGKVIIKIRDEEKSINSKPNPIFMNAYPKVICDKNQSYVIVEGLTEFGLELVEWLILRGARNIILNSRSTTNSGYELYKIQRWKSYGVSVTLDGNDVTNETGVRNLLKLAISLAPIRGIFNVAMALYDKPFLKQTTKSFTEASGLKARATFYLDQLSRTMCPHLEYFVVFSSPSSYFGNTIQTNGMFNSVIERICEARQEYNLPALAIQWGPMRDVGSIVDMTAKNETLPPGDFLEQKINSCLEVLESLMKQENAVVSSMIVAKK